MFYMPHIRYGFAIMNPRPFVGPVVTKGERFIRVTIPYWWSWTGWDSLKAFLFGEMSLIKSYWTYE